MSRRRSTSLDLIPSELTPLIKEQLQECLLIYVLWCRPTTPSLADLTASFPPSLAQWQQRNPEGVVNCLLADLHLIRAKFGAIKPHLPPVLIPLEVFPLVLEYAI